MSIPLLCWYFFIVFQNSNRKIFRNFHRLFPLFGPPNKRDLTSRKGRTSLYQFSSRYREDSLKRYKLCLGKNWTAFLSNIFPPAFKSSSNIRPSHKSEPKKRLKNFFGTSRQIQFFLKKPMSPANRPDFTRSLSRRADFKLVPPVFDNFPANPTQNALPRTSRVVTHNVAFVMLFEPVVAI